MRVKSSGCDRRSWCWSEIRRPDPEAESGRGSQAHWGQTVTIEYSSLHLSHHRTFIPLCDNIFYGTFYVRPFIDIRPMNHSSLHLW